MNASALPVAAHVAAVWLPGMSMSGSGCPLPSALATKTLLPTPPAPDTNAMRLLSGDQTAPWLSMASVTRVGAPRATSNTQTSVTRDAPRRMLTASLRPSGERRGCNCGAGGTAASAVTAPVRSTHTSDDWRIGPMPPSA